MNREIKNDASKECWFCGGFVRKATTAYKFEMYGEVQRSLPRLSWSTLSISVPRCMKCKVVHMMVQVVGWGIAALVLLQFPKVRIWLDFPPHGEMPVADEKMGAQILLDLLMLAIWGVISLVCGKGGRRLFLLLLQTKSLDSYKSFPRVVEHLEHGWKVGKEPPEAE